MTTRTRRWTTDLLVVLTLTVLATGGVLLGREGSLLRTVLVAPFVVFLPGYALVSALFPERRGETGSSDDSLVFPPGTVGDGLSGAARIGLATAASIALVPTVVLVLYFAVGGLPVVEGFFLLAAFTVVLTLVALFRRYRLPESERYAVPGIAALVVGATRPFRIHEKSLSPSRTFVPSSKRGLLLNVVLAVSVVALVSSVAVAYTLPTGEQQFTELYLVTQSEDGSFVATDYPRDFTVGETRPVYVTIANHERQSQSYTLVVELQRVESTPNGTTVTQETELSRVSRTVAAGDATRIEHGIQPSFGGARLRVQYLLYRGSPPSDPSAETAYRSAHLWISASGGAGGT
jgi:uncharacterized membrane protein